jgi:hypothetical protein
MRGARDLATMIESYLEADDASTSNGSGGSVTTPTLTDYDTRQQLRQLTQTTNQLKQDNANLQKDIVSLKNNLQMAMIFPMLLNQQLTVVSDVNAAGTNKLTGASAANNIATNDTITFKSADPLSALLPALLMSGSGDSADGSMNSSMMLAIALALK